MSAQFLTVRLSEAEALLITRLQSETGLSKSEVVKRALKSLSEAHVAREPGGLYKLGHRHFGRHGDASRQSADIKGVVRERLNARRTAR